MKKAFSTLACQNLDYKEVAECAINAGINAIEVRLHNGNKFFNLSLDEIPEAVAYLKKCNVSVTDLGAYIVLSYYDPEVVAEGKRCIDMAEVIETRAVRIFLGNFIKRFSEESPHDYQDIVKMLKELCAYALEKNIEIWIEMHNAFSTGKVLSEVLRDVGYDNLKIIWDVMHSYEFAEMPKETLSYLGNKVAHVHIKDGVRKEDPDLILCRYTKLGEGTVPIKEAVSLLEASGYDGYYSLEWESEWRSEIKETFVGLPDLLKHFNHYMDSVEEDK